MSVELIVPCEVDAPEAPLAKPPSNPVAADHSRIVLRKLVPYKTPNVLLGSSA